AILPRKPHWIARRIDCDAEALLAGRSSRRRGRPQRPAYQCTARCAAGSPAQTEVAIGCFCCRKVSDRNLFSAADPRARHAETAASAKMRKLRHCTNSGIAQTTGDCGPMREPAPSTRDLAQRRAPSASLHDVVRGLDGHLDVVRVALLQPRGGQADELALGLEVVDGARADVEHRLPQTAGELVGDLLEV